MAAQARRKSKPKEFITAVCGHPCDKWPTIIGENERPMVLCDIDDDWVFAEHYQPTLQDALSEN